MSSTLLTATQAGLLLVDSGSSKHFIDPGLIRGIESECTTIEPPMEVTEAENDVLLGTAQEILLVVIIRGTDNVLRTVKRPIVQVPGLKRNTFSSSAVAQKALNQS